MKKFALVALLATLVFSVVSSASAAELKARGSVDAYGLWSKNLADFDSDKVDGDNYMTTQRVRTYFDFVSSENLKAVLGLEMDADWGNGADWGTDVKNLIEVKHAYLAFTLPDTAVSITAGLQPVALPGVFGNPIFNDDAAAIVVSAPINDMVGVAVGYTRGADSTTNTNTYNSTGVPVKNADDDIDMVFVAVPVTLDGVSVTPYAAAAWIGGNVQMALGQQDLSVFNTLTTATSTTVRDGATVQAFGANMAVTMFDPITVAGDLMWAQADAMGNSIKTAGYYADLAVTYKMDMLTATLFGTYATGVSDKNMSEQTLMPTLAEGWGISPFFGGARAFSTTSEPFPNGYGLVADDGQSMKSIGLVLDKMTFVDNLTHKLILAYVQGTSADNQTNRGLGTVLTVHDSAKELALVNTYQIYENLAAINELGYAKFSMGSVNSNTAPDAATYATVGLKYTF